MEDFLVGDHVDWNGHHGVVRFAGMTKFSDGLWVGLELDTPTGKNNGIVQGEQYFSCPDKFGMFVRPPSLRLMERPPPKRQVQKRNTVTSPPPAVATKRMTGLRSPTKPASPVGGVPMSVTPGSSGPGTPRTMTPTIRTPTTAVRPTRTGSMAPPPAPGSRPGVPAKRASASSMSRTASSSSAASSGTAKAPTPAVSRPQMKGGLAAPMRRATGSTSGGSSPDAGLRRARTDTITDKAPVTPAKGMARRESLAALGSSKPSPAGSPATSNALAAAQRESEDLKSKIKILEKKRQEDREKLSTLQRVQEEKDKYQIIIEKLQQKYQPQQVEMNELRKKMKEMEAEMEEMEEIKAEHDMIVEMATLDREMAEEQTEAFKAELDAVRGKAEELEMEVEILREENAELAQGMSPEEKSSAGWLQLEKQNSRLKEALLRLREITESAEIELKDNIKSLEEDVTDLTKYKDSYQEMQEKMQGSEAAVDELRQQLEAALGAEEMLEELTERNMDLSEQIDELRATVEDLESLKEISDELEINHVETEKQMQEEVDYKDQIISEQARKIVQLDASNEEAEYTITKFRDVVVGLQSDLEDMRASQQITETEAQDLTARSRSMMDINMKLQITAAKAQNKTIDLELRRMEAEEAIEHLAVVQMFLPETFHTERDSVLALLRFKRVAFKSHLLQTFVKERLTNQTSPTIGSDDTFMASCDMCDKLTWVSSMCDRFINCINTCTPQQFHKFQGALYELDPVERALNGWIEGLRRDELKEKACAAELSRTMALMSHLAEIHLPPTLEAFASDAHMRVELMQAYMDSASAALSHVRQLVQSKLPSMPEEGEDNEIATTFAKKTDAMISHSRSAKVVISKILRAVDDFRTRSLSLTMDKLSVFEEAEEQTRKLTGYIRAVGEGISELLYPEAEDSDTQTPGWETVQNKMLEITEKTLGFAESEMWGSYEKELRVLTGQLAELGSTATDIDMTAEFEKAPSPWYVRAQELRKTKTVSADVSEALTRSQELLHERATQIKLRDLALEESAVKIELLESRMQNVAKQSSRIDELTALLSDSEKREKDYIETIEGLNEELQTLEATAQKLKKAAEDKRAVGDSDRAGQERAVATQREVAGLQREITALRGAVAFFREENARFRHQDTLDWLRSPLVDPVLQEVRDFEADLRREAADIEAELVRLATATPVLDLGGIRAAAKPVDAAVSPEAAEAKTETATEQPTAESTGETPAAAVATAAEQQPEQPVKDRATRFAWRPLTAQPKVQVAAARERYEDVRAWTADLVERTFFHDDCKKALHPQWKGRGEPAAWVDVRAPALRGRLGAAAVAKGGEAPGVVIRESEGWEEFQRAMGIAE